MYFLLLKNVFVLTVFFSIHYSSHFMNSYVVSCLWGFCLFVFTLQCTVIYVVNV